MDIVKNILNNAWFVGIMTGVFVYFITNIFTKIKSNKEYINNVNQVSKEMLALLQEFIVEKNMPDNNVLLSYYKATCFKYKVKIRDADTINDILNTLTKEILDSKFISSIDKISYCKKIEDAKVDFNQENIPISVIEEDEDEKIKLIQEMDQARKQIIIFISVFLSYIVFILVLYKNDSILVKNFFGLNYVYPILISLMTILVIVFYILLLIVNNRRNKILK
ncbi:hypothetical protein D0439_04350 [Lysinibacillus fusiformis]|uniref:hypothetical protein n=1 Tax=Lysinibacillus fusiformis TaxID=28031 RepID=UPI0011BB9F65|nr:hypothetical protein [Lysinibacillus fusiformis]QDZ97898.1 hypothetical protein D0439_04350 [Lysinibacillus fusiformis]